MINSLNIEVEMTLRICQLCSRIPSECLDKGRGIIWLHDWSNFSSFVSSRLRCCLLLWDLCTAPAQLNLQASQAFCIVLNDKSCQSIMMSKCVPATQNAYRLAGLLVARFIGNFKHTVASTETQLYASWVSVEATHTVIIHFLISPVCITLLLLSQGSKPSEAPSSSLLLVKNSSQETANFVFTTGCFAISLSFLLNEVNTEFSSRWYVGEKTDMWTNQLQMVGVCQALFQARFPVLCDNTSPMANQNQPRTSLTANKSSHKMIPMPELKLTPETSATLLKSHRIAITVKCIVIYFKVTP